MEYLNFSSVDQFENLFSYKDKKIVHGIHKAINEAYLFSKKTAKIFSINFQDSEVAFEISLPRKEWPKALETVLTYYESNGTDDQCIDTWKLIDNIEKFYIK